ncbi:hypothetical protein P4V58_20805 [Bacillus wiedmannii]|uniref:hypothetical protein n=1 Tax=Bacillus TaxID=1386 RepID=UPI002E24F835|nr:hypothetical protein [Bacillus wiedmannii]
MGNRFDAWNEGIDVDITHIMARIVANGKDLPFTSVRTSAWINGPANELYRFMWSRVPVMLTMYFLQGADVMRFARVAGVDESVTGEYRYHFIW